MLFLWGNKKKGASEVVAPSNENQPKEDLEKKAMGMLNDSKFMESLDKNPNFNAGDIDIENPESVKKLEQAFEAFKIKSETQKETHRIFNEEIKNELGLKLDSADMEAIDEYFETALIENPERLTELAAEFKALADMKKELQTNEVAIKKLGSKEQLDQKFDVAVKINKTGWWAKFGNDITSEYSKLKNEAQINFKLDVKHIRDEIEKIRGSVGQHENATEKINELKERIADFKNKLFREIDSEGKIVKLATEKAMEKLNDAIGKYDAGSSSARSITELGKTAEGLMKLDSSESAGKESIFAEQAERAEVEKWMKEINEKLEASYAKQIDLAVEKIQKVRTYQELEKNLLPLLKTEKVGNLSKEKIHEFIFDGLEKQLKTASVSESAIISTFIKKNKNTN
jgi:hypothetical protein